MASPSHHPHENAESIELRLAVVVASLPQEQAHIIESDLRENGLADSRGLALKMRLTEREVCDIRIVAQETVRQALGLPWFHVVQELGLDLPERELSDEELEAEVRAAGSSAISEKQMDDVVAIAEEEKPPRPPSESLAADVLAGDMSRLGELSSELRERLGYAPA